MYDPDSPLQHGITAPTGLPEPLAKARFAEERLTDAVICCLIAPGETISEANVMERFGLTRAAARAALTRLGHDGWARPLARAGWEILPVTGNLIGQVLEARRVAEPAAMARGVLDPARREKLDGLRGMIAAVGQQADPAARKTMESFVTEAETLLLGAADPFTARHVNALWQHTARIARHLAMEDPIAAFRRDQAPALIAAALNDDRAGIAAQRTALVDMQEGVFLRALLTNEAALGPGSGSGHRHAHQTAVHNGSTI